MFTNVYPFPGSLIQLSPHLSNEKHICHLMMIQGWSNCKTGLTLRGMQIQGPIKASPSPPSLPSKWKTGPCFIPTATSARERILAGNWLRQNKYCSPLDNTPVIQINKYYLSTYCVHNTSSKQSISASGHVVGQESQAGLPWWRSG